MSLCSEPNRSRLRTVLLLLETPLKEMQSSWGGDGLTTRVNSREHASVICEASRSAGYSLDYKLPALARHAPSRAHLHTSPGQGFSRQRVEMKLGFQILPALVRRGTWGKHWSLTGS